MDYKTKTQAQVSFDCSMETAGAIVPVSKAPSQEEWPEDRLTKGVNFLEDGCEEVIANRLAAVGLDPTKAEVEKAIAEFDQEYPTIAEVVRERKAFVAKRERVLTGIRGQVKIAASSLLASLVVISGIGFVSRVVVEYQAEQERQELRQQQEAEALREAGRQWAIRALDQYNGGFKAQVWVDLIKTSKEVKAEGYSYAKWLHADYNISDKELERIEELYKF